MDIWVFTEREGKCSAQRTVGLEPARMVIKKGRLIIEIV